MIGQTLAHYEILARLGSGGMADIYRARDTRLGRELALKVLPPDLARNAERRQRFLREAKALANLKHPNIVTLYSAEEEGENLFITMELVDGRTVRDLLPPDGFSLREILNIAVPLVNAVSYAHKHGVLHRDLKPSNLMLDEEGRTKVLDFGLAKLLEEDDQLAPADVHVTGEGRVIGTAAYMSPEQAEGKPIDQRTDIFSLGIVLYEMATGTRPFKGESSASTVSAILRDEPTPVHGVNQGLPRYLGRIISRCLAKEPDQRYQTAMDLQNELEDLRAEVTSATGMAAARAASLEPDPLPGSDRRGRLGLAGALLVLVIVLAVWQPWEGREPNIGSRPNDSEPASASEAAPSNGRIMIAVLPFENLGAAEDAYFTVGVTQEINNALASVSNLGVISRTSASRYADTQKTVREIGNELGVAYVVEGSVRWQKGTDGPDRVRVTPQLIRVSDDTQLWSSQYDRDLEDIFEIQSEIAQEIVNQLGSALAVGGSQVNVSGPITENLEAYQEYLKATHIWERLTTPEDWTGVFAGYERAVELDPTFIEAWTRLSMSHSRIYHNFEDRSENRLIKARAAADRVFEIKPGHPMGYVAMGHYYYWGLKDYRQALAAFAKTGHLLESDADVISAIAYISRRQGRMEEALEQLKKALPLSPRDPALAYEVAFTLQCLRRFDEAAPLYDLAVALAPEQDSYFMTKATNELYRTGDPRKAEAVARQAPAFTDPDWNHYWSTFKALDGDYEGAIRIIENHPEQQAIEAQTQYLPMSLWLGLVSWCTDDTERTERFARAALEDIESRLEETPGDERYRLARGKAYALLGRKEEAIQEGRLAMDSVPLSGDALRSFDFKWRVAEIAAMVGEHDMALDLVEEILALPGGVSAAYIKNSPWFASLRGNERFEALVGGSS